ncbi:MAG: DUF1579 family protein [Ignavibacteria bacterium]|nr:DUF1579 family protein [Ignavibacteria bacterium]
MNHLNYCILIILFLLITIPSFSQNNENTIPCSSAEASQFNFWVGKWKVEWQNTDSTKAEGMNVIQTILGGCVIEENFDGNPGVDFIGKSFSVYNPAEKIWQQTWVDDQGGYMVFTGRMENNKMILSRKISRNNKELIQRMVFYNISKNDFDWNWESSEDNGKTWKLNWKIHYTRL